MKNVLVSGASIAGLTTAHWLRRHGFAVTETTRIPDGPVVHSMLRPGAGEHLSPILSPAAR